MNQKYSDSFRDQIRIEYVTNLDATLRSLSRLHGVSESTLKQWKSKDGWDAEREEYRNEVTSNVCTEIADKKSEQLAKINNVAVGAVEHWLSLFDPETEEGRNRLAVATTAEMKLIKELMQASGNGRISKDMYNITQNNISGMSEEELAKLKSTITKEIDVY